MTTLDPGDYDDKPIKITLCLADTAATAHLGECCGSTGSTVPSGLDTPGSCADTCSLGQPRTSPGIGEPHRAHSPDLDLAWRVGLDPLWLLQSLRRDEAATVAAIRWWEARGEPDPAAAPGAPRLFRRIPEADLMWMQLCWPGAWLAERAK